MAEDKNDSKNLHRGHRQRVKKQFSENGFKGMEPHEVLEMLLFFGIPHKNTNDIAHRLIAHYKNLPAVFAADRQELADFKDMTENAAYLIKMILPLYKFYSEELFKQKPVFEKPEDVVAFLRNLYVDKTHTECIYILCFDSKDSLITYRMLSEGDINSSVVDYRKLAAIVLETKASSIIISHNHPHGIPLPSKDDIDVTKALVPFMETLKVKVKDHVILTDDSHFSMANSPRFVHIFYGLDNPFENESAAD